MQLVCKEVAEWIEEEVTRPVEEWVERSEKKCKKWPWPLNWACKVVTTVVKVVTWVVEKVGKWIVVTVCTAVNQLFDVTVGILHFFYELFAGIFTLDWERIVDAFVDLFVTLVGGLMTTVRVVLLGETLDYIVDEIQKRRLRDYVRDLIENADYSEEEREDIRRALGVDHGAFGFRVRAKAIRTFVDSHFKSDPSATSPDLLTLHTTPGNDFSLFELAGYEYKSFWNRSRYEPVRKGIVATGGGGFGSGLPKASRSDIEKYIDSNGTEGPEFVIRSMSDAVMKTKLDAAKLVCRDLGLMLRWDTALLQVSELQDIYQPGTSASLETFLADVVQRNRKSANEAAARRDLCTPTAVGIFDLTNGRKGVAATLADSVCQECFDCGGAPGLEGKDVSGCTFKDRIPDFVWKYVPAHELGHYFGLCHPRVGVDRVMFAQREGTGRLGRISIRLLYSYLYMKGRPSFVLYEAKEVWNYIIANVPVECLRTRH